jgi:hypothetical protein
LYIQKYGNYGNMGDWTVNKNSVGEIKSRLVLIISQEKTGMMRIVMIFSVMAIMASCVADGGQSGDVRERARESLKAQPVEAGQASGGAVASSVMADNIRMMLPRAAMASGDTACFAIKVGGFRDVLGMQYTLSWDKSVLQYVAVGSFGLPGMSKENFGVNLAPVGKVTAAWIENSLKGISLDEGAEIYQICFKAIGKAGQSSELSVGADPTAIEVVTAGDQVWGIDAPRGRITVQ